MDFKLLIKFNLHVVNEFKRQQLMASSVSKHFLTLHSLFADDDIITSTVPHVSERFRSESN